MTTIKDAFVNAMLADASYVNELTPDLTGTGLTILLAGRLTPDLAKLVGDNFTVLTQVESPGSSFDAVVWLPRHGQQNRNLPAERRHHAATGGGAAVGGGARGRRTERAGANGGAA